MIKLVPIKPKANALNVRAMEKAVRDTMTSTAKDAKRDLEATTATWKHRVTFDVTQTKDGFTVTTDDPVWLYQDEGTKAHVIVPRKMRFLRFITGGQMVFARVVHHPGTKARAWSKKIGKQYQAEIAHRMNEAIGGVIGGH